MVVKEAGDTLSFDESLPKHMM